MSINRHRIATYITIATTAAIIALKTQPGTKTHTAAAELATAMLANIIARAVKARWGQDGLPHRGHDEFEEDD